MLPHSLLHSLQLFPPCWLRRSPSSSPCLFPFSTSHPFSSIHSISLFPSAFFTLSLVFLFPSPFSSSQFLARAFPILPLKSPPCPFSLCSRPVLLLFSSLYYTPLIFSTTRYQYGRFSPSFFFSPFLTFFFDPQFRPCYYSPGSSSLFLFSFCPLAFPLGVFR
jgi:hypothetical protein